MLVALDDAAPPECPARAALVAAIHARSPSASFDGPATRRYAIAITHRDDAYAGAVDGRELTARRCSDLVTALALVVSLAIEADETAEARPPVAAPIARPEPRWWFEGGANVALGFGITPDPLVVAELEVRARTRAPIAIAVAAMAGHDRASEEMGAAAFTLVGGRATACWLPVRGAIEVGACGHIELGAIDASGESIAQGRSVTRLWLAPGVDAYVRWPATSRVFGQLDVAGSLPLVRDRYLFEPNMTIHETAAVTSWLGLGVGMRFR